MSKRRGVSKAEKRSRLTTLLWDSKAPWTLKELEKHSKKLGINSMVVKDIMQELVDDNLVCLEKIGSANYYWSFPSEAYRKAEGLRARLTTDKETRKRSVEEMEGKISELEPGREQTGEYKELMASLQQKRRRIGEVKEELKTLKANDPETLRELTELVEHIKAAVCRHTDNMYSCKSFIVKKAGLSKGEAANMLQMGPNFDYPE